MAWLIGTARHKLVDHWRRTSRQRDALAELWEQADVAPDSNDPVDTLHVREVLAHLLPHHRSALAFDVLRAPDTPMSPDPEFAARLRARLADLPTRTETMMENTVTPYLVVDGAAAAIDFYVSAFGAVEQHRLVGDGGRIGHAELVIGNSRVMLADEHPEIDALAPTTRGGSSTSFTLAVADVDAVFARALELGATEVRPVTDQFYGQRQGSVRDAWGHQWHISSPIAGFDDEQYAANSRELGYTVQPGTTASFDHQVKHHDRGDLYYFTLPTADIARAQAFFGALLGWRFAGPEAGHVENISAPPGSLQTGVEGPRLWFVVDDIHAAADQVRALGGTAGEPVLYDSGWDVECTDDQGTRFHLSVPADKYTR